MEVSSISRGPVAKALVPTRRRPKLALFVHLSNAQISSQVLFPKPFSPHPKLASFFKKSPPIQPSRGAFWRFPQQIWLCLNVPWPKIDLSPTPELPSPAYPSNHGIDPSRDPYQTTSSNDNHRNGQLKTINTQCIRSITIIRYHIGPSKLNPRRRFGCFCKEEASPRREVTIPTEMLATDLLGRVVFCYICWRGIDQRRTR